MSKRKIKCEWCGHEQIVFVDDSPMGKFKCAMCKQSLARMVARDILING